MNAENFLENFSHIANATGGIRRIRDLVLFAAITGKLSLPKKGDSNAALIAADSLQSKERYDQQNNVRRSQRKHVEIFQTISQTPKHWQLLPAGDLVHLINGRAFKSNEWKTSGLPIIRIQNLNDAAKSFNYFQGEVSEGHRIKKGDMLLSWSGTPGTSFGAFIWEGGDAVLNQHIFKVVIYSDLLDKEYLRMTINACLDALIGSARGGVGLKHVTKGQIEALQIPLPPLEEQKRIVCKVDELMKLCDELERQQQERSRLFPLLSHASHARLAAHPTPTNLAAIFTDPPTLSPDDMRRTIRSLAVRGFLLPQSSSDGHSQDLLTKVATHRAKLLESNLVAKPKKVRPIDETPFPIPSTWTWVRLGRVTLAIDYGTSQRADLNPNNIPVYRMGNIKDGALHNTNMKYVPSDIGDLPRLYLEPNDILFNRTNSAELVGKAAIFKGEKDTHTFASYLIRVRLPRLLSADYFNLCFDSHYFRSTQIEPEITQQCGQANFNGTKLANSLFPVPPIAEQRRIVATVDHLVSLVEEIEARQLKTNRVAELFAQSVVATITGIEIKEQLDMKAPKTVLVTSLIAEGKPKKVGNAPLATILAKSKSEVSAKELWQKSGLGIDAFYSQLKAEMNNGWIAEPNKGFMQEMEAN